MLVLDLFVCKSHSITTSDKEFSKLAGYFAVTLCVVLGIPIAWKHGPACWPACYKINLII